MLLTWDVVLRGTSGIFLASGASGTKTRSMRYSFSRRSGRRRRSLKAALPVNTLALTSLTSGTLSSQRTRRVTGATQDAFSTSRQAGSISNTRPNSLGNICPLHSSWELQELKGAPDTSLGAPISLFPSSTRMRSRVPIHVDSNCAGAADRYSTHAGCELIGTHPLESWDATDQVRTLSSAEAELYGIVDGAARGTMAQNLLVEIEHSQIAEVNRNRASGPGCDSGEVLPHKIWPVKIGCDSSAAIGISSSSGVGKTRHMSTRWVWVQDSISEKQITLKNIKTDTNVSDIGTKSLEPKRHQELIKQLPLAPPACKRSLAALATLTLPLGDASQGGVCAIMCPAEGTSHLGWSSILTYTTIGIVTFVVIRICD